MKRKSSMTSTQPTSPPPIVTCSTPYIFPYKHYLAKQQTQDVDGQLCELLTKQPKEQNIMKDIMSNRFLDMYEYQYTILD